MKICFYASGRKSGLANNGGSKTILRSIETLKKLGHEAYVVAKYDQFSWFRHSAPATSIRKGTDAVVAVSARDVTYAIDAARGMPVYWWMRGLEKWQFPEEELVHRAKLVRPITNSSHLSKWLAYYDIYSQVCYAGLDLDMWNNDSSAPRRGVGCLSHSVHKTKRYDVCEKVMKHTPDMFWEILNKKPHINLDDNRLKWLYNSCKIWLATTELEGFHNVPAEAALCGCLVVCNKHKHNGMSDYADDTTAMRYSTPEEALSCLKNPDYSLVPRMQEKIREKIGSREKNMQRFVELIS